MSGEEHLFSTFCLIPKPYLSGSRSHARPATINVDFDPSSSLTICWTTHLKLSFVMAPGSVTAQSALQSSEDLPTATRPIIRPLLPGLFISSLQAISANPRPSKLHDKLVQNPKVQNPTVCLNFVLCTKWCLTQLRFRKNCTITPTELPASCLLL